MFGHLVDLHLVQHDMACREAFLHIDEALIGRATELEFQGTLRQNERPVDEYIGKRQQFQQCKDKFCLPTKVRRISH